VIWELTTYARTAPARIALDPVTQDVITFSQFRLFADERLIERSGELLQLGGRVKDGPIERRRVLGFARHSNRTFAGFAYQTPVRFLPLKEFVCDAPAQKPPTSRSCSPKSPGFGYQYEPRPGVRSNRTDGG
jgi:hypothetical protein